MLAPPAWTGAPWEPNPPAGPVGPTSADDFDWRQMVPYLYVAAQLPGEQGLKELLENLPLLRAYVANEPPSCRTGSPCPALDRGSLPPAEVTRRIDQIVQEETFHKQKITRLDYLLSRHPYPFTAIAALKTDNHQDAYLVLDFAEHSYTCAEVQQKYGEPYDTDVLLWFGVYKYRVETARYSARVAFTIDPADGEVRRMAIRLKKRGAQK